MMNETNRNVEDQKNENESESSRDAEPEFSSEKRNLKDLWLQVFPVGTGLDRVHDYKWNFSNLEEALKGGELHDKRVYLFGCTERPLFRGQSKVTIIPAVVAVVSSFPPSDKIGIFSAQLEVVPMKQMKMDWVPYVPLENRESQVENLKDTQIFVLSCNQRSLTSFFLRGWSKTSGDRACK